MGNDRNRITIISEQYHRKPYQITDIMSYNPNAAQDWTPGVFFERFRYCMC